MGGSQRPFLIRQDLSNPSWSKVLETQEKKKRCRKIKSRTRVFLMKRRASIERQRRSAASVSGYGIGRRLRILKKLIPNGESTEIDTLFREAADYILALQMRVKAMQIMVNVLSGSSSNDDDQ